MTAISIVNGAVPTLIAAAGNRDFLHIYNNSDTTIYVAYDSDAATQVASLTTSNGIPIAAGVTLQLNNDGIKNIFTKPVYGIHSAGAGKEVRVQGA